MNINTGYTFKPLFSNQSAAAKQQEQIGRRVDSSDVSAPYINFDQVKLDSAYLDDMRQWSIANYKAGDTNVVDNTAYAQEFGFRKTTLWDENGKLIPNAVTAADGYSKGFGTHAFLYISTDFLTEAAQQYAKLDDGEAYKWRAIFDDTFIKDAVSFFTGRDATNEEVKALKEQMDVLVNELATRIKNGEDTDLHTLKSKMTIAGHDVTIGQLTNMQKETKALSENTMNQVATVGPNNFARIGLAQSFATLFAKESQNTLGDLFSSAISRLASNNINSIQNLYNGYQNIASTMVYKGDFGRETANLFANLDTSSKENMVKDFDSKIKTYTSMLETYNHRTADNVVDTQEIRDQFEAWMKLL